MHWLGTLSPCVLLDVKDFVLVLVAWLGVHVVILMCEHTPVSQSCVRSLSFLGCFVQCA